MGVYARAAPPGASASAMGGGTQLGLPKIPHGSARPGRKADVRLHFMVPGERIELPTFALQKRCSTAELTRHIKDLASEPAFCHRIAIARK